MSMSSNVVAFRPPDEKWKKMKEIWDLCKETGVPVPEQVSYFFNYEEPDGQGVSVSLETLHGCLVEYKTEYSEGYEVHLDKLPPNVKIIRFYNSW